MFFQIVRHGKDDLAVGHAQWENGIVAHDAERKSVDGIQVQFDVIHHKLDYRR